MVAPSLWLVQSVAAAAGVLACVMAALVLRFSVRSTGAKVLAGVLFLEGALQLLTAWSPPVGDALWWQRLVDASFVVPLLWLPWLYLWFLATIEAPASRPLARWVRVWRLGSAGAGLVALGIVGSHTAGTSLDPWPLLMLSLLLYGVVLVWGFVVAVSAWRASPRGTLAFRRAQAYLLGFGTRDVLLLAGVVAFFVEEALYHTQGVHLWSALLMAIGMAAFAPLLTVGILRTRLLDIDMHVRWTVSKATVGAVFVAAYVVATQAASVFVAPRHGVAIGVAVLVGLLAVLVPLHRAAERMAGRVVPERGPGDVERDRLELYRLALDELGGRSGDAAVDRYLAGLRRRLGLSARDHAILEHVMRTGSYARGGLHAGAVVGGRFHVVRDLGQGAQAKVWLAEDSALGRKVVLKVVRAEREPHEVLQEGRFLAGVVHPNVAQVFDVIDGDGEVLLVTEFVAGGSLRDRLRNGPLPPEDFRILALGLCDGLAAVHGAGLVHRDVKPANVLLSATGAPKLTDFGVAALAGVDGTRDDMADAGAAVGTVRYMAPEQAAGRPLTPSADQYGAAATLYEACTGRPLVEVRDGETAAGLQRRIARDPPRPSRGALPAALTPWFERALDVDPKRRFGDMGAMRAALVAALDATQRS